MACPPFLQNRGRVKNCGKEFIGEGQKILILRKGFVLWGVDYPGRKVQIIFGKKVKLHNHSVKNNCYLL